MRITEVCYITALQSFTVHYVHIVHIYYFHSLIFSVNRTSCISHGRYSLSGDPGWGAESYERWLPVSIVFVNACCGQQDSKQKVAEGALKTLKWNTMSSKCVSESLLVHFRHFKVSDYYVFSRSWFGHCPPLRFIFTLAISSAPIMLHYLVTGREMYDKEAIKVQTKKFTHQLLFQIYIYIIPINILPWEL